MRIVLLGPPASGKSTVARRLARKFGVPHLSSGRLLRAEVANRTPLGRRVEERLVRGELVDDATVTAVVTEHLAGAHTGWVLDGFPRTREQAGALDAHADQVGALDAVLYLDVNEPELLRRARGRADIEGRADDSVEVVRHRLGVFAENTEQVVRYYELRGLLARVDGSAEPEAVADAAVAALVASDSARVS